MEPRWVSQEWREASPCPEPSSGATDGMFCPDVKGQQGLAMQDAVAWLSFGFLTEIPKNFGFQHKIRQG